MKEVTFQFNQAEIESLIDKSQNNLMISYLLVNINGKDHPYLAAQKSDKNSHQPLELHDDPPAGCPVPPGWQKNTPNPPISHMDLLDQPKFFLNAVNKLELTKNKFVDPVLKEPLLELRVQLLGNVIQKAFFVIKEEDGGTNTLEAEIK